MRRLAIVLVLVGLAGGAAGVSAQTFSARRMGMGGVLLGSAGDNVAYRAVPSSQGAPMELTLPLGLISVIANPPQLDPDKPDFNIYELANTLYNPPWNLQIVSPDPPSSDITVAVGKNSLAVDLGDIKNVFPKDHSRLGNVGNGPSYGVGLRNVFIDAGTLIHYQNDMSLNAPLHAALAEGAPFATNTQYAMLDNARGQTAAGILLGCAGPLLKVGKDPRAAGSTALYAGARLKLMRGLAYGDANNVVSFTTSDTLFASNPVDVRYDAALRDAGPAGGRFGRGLDLGAAWFHNGLELGVGVNDVATRIGWRVRQSIAYSDSATGDVITKVIDPSAKFTSTVPTTVVANAAWTQGPWMVAADVVGGIYDALGHVGAERWIGPVAVRGGMNLDATHMLQFGTGVGVKLGRFGVDLGAATNSRNLSRQRGVELGLGVALYGGGSQ